MAYWFHVRFGVEPATWGDLLRREPARRGLVAVGVADRARIGLVNTMVFTHLPSNVLLILVPLMPTLPLAVLVLLLRFSLSQMDVPTRQSYVIASSSPTSGPRRPASPASRGRRARRSRRPSRPARGEHRSRGLPFVSPAA
jgi:hypothetical protein